MKISRLYRHGLGFGLAAALLAACGGQSATTSAVPVGATAATQTARGQSWMKPGASSSALVYAVRGCSGTCVFTYPSGQYVGALVGVYASAVCSDDQGNVYFPNTTGIAVYAHGGTTPIATLSLPDAKWTGGCSVDPVTHNLAVMAAGSYYDIAIFPNAQGTATFYASGVDAVYPAYDNSGNLFVDGLVGQNPGLAELPYGASTFNQIAVPESVQLPGQLQWDGKYLAWQAGETGGPRRLSRLSISGSQATVVSARDFHGFKGWASQLWIYKADVIVPYALRHGDVEDRKIGVWSYPRLQRLSVFPYHSKDADFLGVTVSVAASRSRTTDETAQAARGRSWMKPGASSGDLLYADGGCGGTCVLSYPGGGVVGALTAGGGISADCSDVAGNVFITANDDIVEYAHGATSPSATLNVPGTNALGCAVDPKTNNLAVVYQGQGANIAIFSDEQGTPTLYNSHVEAYYCGYDNAGDLFVDGYAFGSEPGPLSELPYGASTFTAFTVNGDVGSPGQLQFDGRYVTWESRKPVKLSRLAISGSTATVVGTTSLDVKKEATQSWLSGNQIFIPYSNNGLGGIAKRIGVWNYPKGKRPTTVFSNFGTKDLDFQGVTLSVGS